MEVVRKLVNILAIQAEYPYEQQDYRVKSRSILTILWVITKLLYGDLTIRPQSKDVNMVDLDSKITISDGTLAAIPFPTKQTVTTFSEEGPGGLTVKGRLYLSAVATASFYRSSYDE